MANSIAVAPGHNLKTFVNHISCDLKKRKIEYSIVGFFNSSGQPIGMIETRGRSSWVEFDSAQPIGIARKINANGICILHNHPRGIKEPPDLKPSQADISSLRNFVSALDGTGLKYLGDWIVSNGHAVEILHAIQSKKNSELDTTLFSDAELASLLTPDLTDVIRELTKTSLLQADWYNISEQYLYNNKVEFKVRSFKYWGENEEIWDFYIIAEDNNGNTCSSSMSIEQAIKSYDAIVELQNVANKLIKKNVEYTEIKIDICDKITCGVFQEGIKQSAFLYIGNNKMFIKVDDLGYISYFITNGLEKIDSVIAQTAIDISPEKNSLSS